MLNGFDINMSDYIRSEKLAEEKFNSLGLSYFDLSYNYNHYTEFISGCLHRNKSYGSEYIVYDFVAKNLGLWHELHENLFAVGYAEWLCLRSNLKFPSYIYDWKDVKLEKLLFHRGVLVTRSYSTLLHRYEDALDIFKKHNLVITESELQEVV